MRAEPVEAGHAQKTYNYLRLTIVVVVVGLIVAVLFERSQVACWLPSLSAYYFTPVHAVFVGALVATGVCMITIRDPDDLADSLLNVAGLMAIYVAFVPTTRPSDVAACEFRMILAEDFDPADAIWNNVTALAVVGSAFIVGAFVIAWIGNARNKPKPHELVGVALAALLLGGMLLWYLVWNDSFVDHAHDVTAIAMFALIGVVVVWSAVRAKTERFRITYFTIVGLAVAAVATVLIANAAAEGWDHEVITVEAIVFSLFAAFWIAQTAEHWNAPVRPQRAA